MLLVVGWILALKGALFLFGARNVVGTLMDAHPVTFDHATRRGERRYVAGLRVAGFLIGLIGALLIWLNI
jgi:hypothetical protein